MKKLLHFLSIAIFFISLNASAQQWDLDGNFPGLESADLFGFSTSLSADGSIIAIGAPNYDGGGTNRGLVRVYEKSYDGTWYQLGLNPSFLTGANDNDQFGYSVSIINTPVDNEIILAVGIPGKDSVVRADSGEVVVYKLNISLNWIESQTIIGQTTTGNSSYEFGKAVSLSPDGSLLAVGAPGAQGNDGVNQGLVKVYANVSGNFIEVHSYSGDAQGDLFGSAISVSNTGEVAIGSVSDNNTFRGLVRVYNSAGQLGGDIVGSVDDERLGTSVSLNDDGSILAIGAVGGGPTIAIASVKVYQYDTNTTDWSQLGSTMVSPDSDDLFGASVSLSADGLTIAVGATGNIILPGKTSIYNYTSDWALKYAAIPGENNADNFGQSVDISGDGSIVAIGAAPSSSSGFAKVYKDPAALGLDDTFATNGVSFYPNPSNGKVFLKGIQDETNIHIYTLNGAIIYNETVLNDTSINLNLNSGLYLAKFSTKNGTTTKKLVIE